MGNITGAINCNLTPFDENRGNQHRFEVKRLRNNCARTLKRDLDGSTNPASDSYDLKTWTDVIDAWKSLLNLTCDSIWRFPG